MDKLAVVYPPVDTPRPLAENLWVVESGPIDAMGLHLPVRMVVVRLPSGALWLHSPTRFTDGLRQALEAIGPIRHLVAPNIAHWTFLKSWQRALPDATVWAAPKLRDRAQVRASGLRLDRDIAEAPPPEWEGAFDLAIVPGGFGFREVAILHRPTRTALLTDLVQNLEPGKLPTGTRLFARLTGAARGTTPLHLRLAIRLGGTAARDTARRIVGWAPERVLFAHGRPFLEDGAGELGRALAWLLR
ncbi:MAG: DUF4336 domain-containing protein [Methylobacteriaceae bacterium]|nr:DUF4336 domain-containing protein [Methylobacteriaceae bacterium]